MNAQSRPTSADHARHDRWLLVRFASHDELDAAESATVRSLLDTCRQCAALVEDIGTIAVATAQSLTPSRPRDFRLTPAQATAQRGSLLRRLLDRLASPTGLVVRPLAGAALAIGLVLVIASGSLPRSTGTPEAAPNGSQPRLAHASASAPAGEVDNANGSSPDVVIYAPRPTDPAGDRHAPQVAGSQDPDRAAFMTMQSDVPGVLAESADPELAGVRATDDQVSKGSAQADSPLTVAGSPGGSDWTGAAILVLGALLAIAGAVVLALNWVARRSSGDPLLR